jgi:hypothetical protein
MCMIKVANAAITLAQQAARSEAAVREPELLSCLTDLLVHLGVWRVHTTALVHDQYAAPAAVAAGDDGVEPTVIVAVPP